MRTMPTTLKWKILSYCQWWLRYWIERTVDPLGGSYYVEALTDEVEKRALEYLKEIEERGGASKAIDYMQDEIHRTAYDFQRQVESGKRIVVGVNAFQEEETRPLMRQPDYGVLEKEQKERLALLRGARDEEAASHSREAVRSAARGNENLMPPVIQAVRNGVTLGEISDALRTEWGTYDHSG